MKTFHDKAKLFFWLTAIILIFHTYVDTAEAQGSSYDCDNVKAGSIEEMICFDKGLSALDRRPAEVYTIAIEKAVNKHPPILKPEQRGWIKGRNDCWKIISFDRVSVLIGSTFRGSHFQPITFNTGLPFNLATTWWTSPKHHFPLGLFVTQWQLPTFFSIWIFSIIVDLPFSM